MLVVQMFQAKINGNTPVTLREIEKWFNGLDEMLARATRATAKGRSAQQRRLPAHPNNSNTYKANSAMASEETTHDFSNYTCYNCNEKGHIASACPKPRHNKNNNNNANGSSARRSNNNNDRKAQSAKRGMAHSRSAAATSNSNGTDGSVEHAFMAHVVHARADEQIRVFFHWESHHQESNLPHARAASVVVIQNLRDDSDRDDCQVVSNSKFLEENQDDWIPLSHNVAKAYAVTVSQAAKPRVNRVQDPSYGTVGVPENLLNWEQDSGSTAHMTPCHADLFDVEEGQNLGVEVADGHIIKCTTTGKVRINMKDDNGHDLKAVLHGVMYVPGLNKWLLSLNKFAAMVTVPP
jgi:hypothetical protein